MNNKDTIKHIKSIMFKLMFDKRIQISNAEDAYIEHEIRLTQDEYRVAYSCFTMILQLFQPNTNINLINDFEKIAKEKWNKERNCADERTFKTGIETCSEDKTGYRNRM